MTITETLRYRVWSALKVRPLSAVGMAEEMDVDADQIRDVYRRLRDSGHITFSHREGREAVYKVTGIDLPTTGQPKGRMTRIKGKSRPYARAADGFGAGKHPLDEVWR